MQLARSLARLFLGAAVLSFACSLPAQGPPDHDHGHGHDNPGHGGMPPGQAKKHGYDEGMPPGQAKKFRFREEDRDHFYAHYREDADHWRGHHRPVFVPGHYVPQGYYMQPVPQSYWVGVVAAPPPGYRYGYYQGYVVAYSPTTRIIADVLDIVSATTH